MIRIYISAIAAILSTAEAVAAETAPRPESPTMGWSSWNSYRVDISEDIIRSQADAMVDKGLLKAGYRYVNIDDGFFGGRDADGRLVIHPRRFPNGLKPVVDHIHSLGLKAGIYSDAGRNTCGNFWDNDSLGVGVGLYGHDAEDARYYFDELGFDFIKVDFCGGDSRQNSDSLQLDERERYTAIRRAIDAVGREDVRINVCRWAFPGTWVHDIGSSWRISADITPDWHSIKRIINANNCLSAYAGEGRYNDMDMLEIGRGLSAAEERTHFGMWCMMSSPLLIGCDLNTIPEESLRLITNPELIALNQNQPCQQAQVVETDLHSGLTLYAKDIESRHGRKRAVAIYNPSDTIQHYRLRPATVGLSGRVGVRDVFNRADLEPIDGDSFMPLTVKGHDTAIFLLEGEHRHEQEVYEAETAWLEQYQQLGINPATGRAEYISDSSCSGGVKVGWLGRSADNFMEWRDVWSNDGGEYRLTVDCLPVNGTRVHVSVNGGKAQIVDTADSTDAQNITITLRPGTNTIKIYNPDEWAPDIDRIRLNR